MIPKENVLTIGDVKNVSKTYYMLTGRKLTFFEALTKAQEFGSTSTSGKFREGFLSFEDLWDYIDQMEIKLHEENNNNCSYDKDDEQLPVEEYGNFYIKEKEIFTENNDINVHIHIPYIQDGIHSHDHFEANYIYSGSATVEYYGVSRILSAGVFLIFAPDTKHNMWTEDDSLVISLDIRKTTFDLVFSLMLKCNNPLTDFFQKALYKKRTPNVITFYTDKDKVLEQYMQSLIREDFRRDVYKNINMVNFLSFIFTTLLRQYNDRSMTYSTTKHETAFLNMGTIMQYIREHSSTVSLNELSEVFHYSESYISKFIRENTDVNFSTLIQNIKLEQARQLLKNTDFNLAQICEAIGYESTEYFSRLFKKHYHCTPSAYRFSAQFHELY